MRIPIIKDFINGLIKRKFKDTISQINVNFKGDVEIRFRNEIDLNEFLSENPVVTIRGNNIICDRKRLAGSLNY